MGKVLGLWVRERKNFMLLKKGEMSRKLSQLHVRGKHLPQE
jgi:hypothetical protein